MNIKDITLHSWRKCACTKLNCGSTAGPSAAAACIREGHSIGSVRNVYIAQERASDEYCGKLLSGLPVNSEEFAVSYPDFIPIDLEKSITERVNERVYQLKKKEVDLEVRSVLDAIFGAENMKTFPDIHKFLRIGLTSHLQHLKTIEELVPPNARLRQTPLFTNPLVAELKQYVKIDMPWQDHHIYFAEATGLPPHVIELAKLTEIKACIDAIPQRVEEILENKQLNGPVSLAQMRRLVENSPAIKKMEEGMDRMACALENSQASDAKVDSFTGGRYRNKV